MRPLHRQACFGLAEEVSAFLGPEKLVSWKERCGVFVSHAIGEESMPNGHRSKTKDRLKRVLVLVRTLESAEPKSIDTLVKEFAVSRRTVFRDLALLREAGIGLRRNRSTETYAVTYDAPPQRLANHAC